MAGVRDRGAPEPRPSARHNCRSALADASRIGQYAFIAISHLAAVGIDAADPRTLAAFYEKLTGWKVAFSSDHFVALAGGPMWLTFHQIADYRRPTWPTSQVPKQMHLDFEVDDLDVAQSEAIQAGAVVADTQPRPEAWRVLLDPEGHPFCLCTPISS